MHVGLGTACWLWQGEMRHGYGRFSTMQRGKLRQHAAHRYMWALVHKKPAGRLYVLHRCDNAACVNPEHLYLGTPSQNMLDAVARGRLNPARGEWSPFAKLTDAKVLALREDRAAGMGVVALSKKYGVSTSVVANVYRGNTWQHVGGPRQVDPRSALTCRKLSPKDEKALVAEYTAGTLAGEVCTRFNISRGTMINTLERHGVARRSPGRPPKLTAAEVKQIRKQYRQDRISMSQLAEQFEVSAMAIHRVLKGVYAPEHGIR